MGRTVSLNLRCTIAMRLTATKPAGANAIVRYEICLIANRGWLMLVNQGIVDDNGLKHTCAILHGCLSKQLHPLTIFNIGHAERLKTDEDMTQEIK